MTPAYVTRETLARMLDMREPGYVDQLVTRGLLPEPVMIGEAKRWRWADVDNRISGGAVGHEARKDEADDPYLRGGHGPRPSPVARLPRHEPSR